MTCIMDKMEIDKIDVYSDFIHILKKQINISDEERDKINVLNHISLTEYLSSLNENKMDYADVEKMALHLSLQIKDLEYKGHSLLFIKTQDILLINPSDKKENQMYVLADLIQLLPLTDKNPLQMMIIYPEDINEENVAPELLTIDQLPFYVHRSACYYSLALLCLKCMKINSLAEADDLKGTKLFYFLERCLIKDPEDRTCFWL